MSKNTKVKEKVAIVAQTIQEEGKLDFSKVEKKWQDKWEQAKLFEAKEEKNSKKYYVLEMFPYPSATGLHMGHAFNFVIGDIYARYKKMQGFNVLHPMGFDSLGLPAENAAIKAKTHPEDYTNNSIKNFIKQQKTLGLTYDWTREVNTADPEYYKWDQWIFLKMFEKGLIYQKKAAVNWCSKCDTILANEQVVNGCCWRHEDTEVEVKQMNQWFIKITDYADRLLEGHKNLNWPEKTIAMQKNWIGKSYGTEIDFEINKEKWPIFTTRPDTIFGVTFMVVAAQHARLNELVTKEQKVEVEKFLKKLKSVSEKDLSEMEKDGVFTGSYAINPANGDKVPVYAGNFVVADYGAGMVMAVPAHDQRDFEFAKKYDIPIKQVISGEISETRAYTESGKLINSKEFNEISNEEAKKKITDWLISKNLARKVVNYKLRDWSVARQRYWGTPIPLIHCEACAINEIKTKLTFNFHGDFRFKSILEGKKTIESRALDEPGRKELSVGDLILLNHEKEGKKIARILEANYFKNSKELYENGKKLIPEIFSNEKINSLKDLENAYKKVSEDYLTRINDSGIGAWRIELQNISKVVQVPEKDLPVKLPKEVKFGVGNPLLTNEKWLNVKCPKCGGKARREANTMDTFVNSSWYFLRYCDPKNNSEIFAKEKAKYWMPVDLYIGGAEHACMHLIYSRFYTMFLHDIGLIDFTEPAPRLFHQGMINGYDGQRMSKSKGNGVEPLETIAKYGVDTTRFYLLSEASPDKGFNWTDAGIQGSLRIVNKIWSISEKIKFGKDSEELIAKLNKSIKLITEQIENIEYRKSTIELRELFDLISKQTEISKESFSKALKLLAPFCPHIAEELWEKLGNKGFISAAEWPKYDAAPKGVSSAEQNVSEKIINNIKPIIDKISETQKINKIYFYVMPFEIKSVSKEKLEKAFGKSIEIFAVNDPNKYDPENKSKKSLPGKPGIFVE